MEDDYYRCRIRQLKLKQTYDRQALQFSCSGCKVLRDTLLKNKID